MVSAIPGDLCCSCLNRRNSFSHYRAIMVDRNESESQSESQKIDDSPVLATCQSGTSAMLSSEVNGPIAHGSTR